MGKREYMSIFEHGVLTVCDGHTVKLGSSNHHHRQQWGTSAEHTTLLGYAGGKIDDNGMSARESETETNEGYVDMVLTFYDDGRA
ncbi:hypothetical protein CERZMDRAFT_90267 [Cercospora zeae-maydis SCOH1-5]|uniref:Uncharacterized protein n=1 Tax=Cercospora zeae-maydis SCOH1-5 TaxID=717836 RepID=A0A6A6FNG3_9PEZI|nr:hypothetical protein CERZMDRAFT_90267 [Cercospora zeae-maydis SCOH1-5]